jgi:hypothetical protein
LDFEKKKHFGVLLTILTMWFEFLIHFSCSFKVEGISTDPDKVKTAQDWPRPKTPKQMMGLSWSLLLLQEIFEKTLQS